MPHRKERGKSRGGSRQASVAGDDDAAAAAARRTRTASPDLQKKSESRATAPPPRDISPAHRNRSHDSSLDKLSDHIASDASNLLDKFRSEFDSTARDFKTKPNVLVAGCTGAGKSTLVNKVFGRTVAQTGSGVPITQHFDRYELEDEQVVIYDSKGLEVGEHDNFIRTTAEFLANGEGTDIHVVWYIINSAGSRFQPFEGDVCKSLFNNLPIIFILNKADLSAKADREQLRQSILALNLQNCIGILDTICTPSLSALKIPDVCPACGSDDIDIKRKRKMMMCEDCGHTQPLTVETGLGMLVSRTMDTLPVLARERFVSAQRVSMHHKNVTARKIIVEFHDIDFRQARLERQLFKVVAKMLIRLSILWEFREYGHEYGTEVAKEHMGQYSLRDRVFLLMHKQDKHQDEKLSHCTALGIIWNRCVRTLYKSLFMQSFGKASRQSKDAASRQKLRASSSGASDSESSSRTGDSLGTLVDNAFAELNIEAIDTLAHAIQKDAAVPPPVVVAPAASADDSVALATIGSNSTNASGDDGGDLATTGRSASIGSVADLTPKTAFTAMLDREFPEELEEDEVCAVRVPLNRELDKTMVVTREAMHGEGDNVALIERKNLRASSNGFVSSSTTTTGEVGSYYNHHHHRNGLTGTTGHHMLTSDSASTGGATGGGHQLASSERPSSTSSSTKGRRHHKHKHSDDPRRVVSNMEGSRGRRHHIRSSSSRAGVTSSSHGHRRHPSTDNTDGDASMRRSSKKHSKSSGQPAESVPL